MSKLYKGSGVLALAFAAVHAACAHTVPVKLIAFNDFHGNLQAPGEIRAGLDGAAMAAGGVDVLAAYIARLKAQDANAVVVSAGDLVGASPLLSALFHDEGTIEAMNRLGLDLNAVGNHEFDEGSAELLRLQNGGCHPTDPQHSCRGAEVGTPVPFEGARFRFLAANVFDAEGNTLFPPYAIKTFDGVRIGFIGLTLRETPNIVVAGGVAGLRFSAEVETINALVPALRASGVNAIVVLIHQGGSQIRDKAPLDSNACAGDLAGSPLRSIVGRLDDAIDVVISGHTHAAYICRLANAVGRTIPVTSAGDYGRALTDIDLRLDAQSGAVVDIQASNILVDRSDSSMTPIASVRSIVDGYAALAAPIANRVVGSIAAPVSSDPDAACESAAGDLIADAQLRATSAGGARIALMNRGGVRPPGFTYPQQPLVGEGDGNVTYGELFTVQPFGNSLVTLTLTGAQLRDVLEQQFAGCMGQTVDRVLQVSAGFKFSYDYRRPACRKITAVTLDGRALERTAKYRVTVNNLLADGGDGFTVLRDGTERLVGPSDIDALAGYLSAYNFSAYDLSAANPGARRAAYVPDDPALLKPRIRRLDAAIRCP